ncbi:homoserine dehydrogenase [Nibricoccus aquaticus]|uniref:Homoserine dehydrogenase n=1 Tax=Nibricoccus aquaticus TaxID=2576891 RepID=A0A290QH81_9BACT|nr:homoserine dehydrogenase [Nibricoccus aquaticus]ATC65636.1 homoserine dehydrogenase [Nibricoccus aquaticus]
MSTPKTIKIGLCGFGTVGQGVWQHLERARTDLEARLGVKLELARAAVRDLKRARDVAIPADKITGDALSIANDPSLAIVCELIGGTTLAREVTLAALKRGAIVVSANKALLCDHGAELFETARKHGGQLLFEASVAGGIPIIKALREGLVANRFTQIYGILNGTCNYILTRMVQEGAPYATILADAKRLGYAEADESLDVDGWDTAHKASVLAFLAHGVWIKTDKMIVEGIAKITQADLKHAAALGYGIKLLAVITRDFAANQLFVRVHPTLIPEERVLASVNGVFNGVSVTGDVVGTTTYIGRGAGRDATASAVISDIVDAAAILATGKAVPSIPGSSSYASSQPPSLAPLEKITGRYYVRTLVKDEPGVLAQIATVMANHKVSIASVTQPEVAEEGTASLILTTHLSNEHAIRETLADLARLPSVVEAPLLLRIGDFAE